MMDAVHRDAPRRLIVGETAALDFGDPGRAPDMVFLHANSFNAATYRTLLAPLSSTRRIIAPDLRGHGETRLPADPASLRSWDRHADDLLALLEALDGPPVVVAGHSMGATSALLAAAKRPGRIRALVLFDPVILPPGAALMMRLPLLSRLSRRHPLARGALRRRPRFESREAAMTAYRGRGAFRGWPDVVLADYVEAGFHDVDGGVELISPPLWEAANYAAQSHDPHGALRRLDRPALIVKAAHGSTTSLTEGRIGRAEVRAAPDGGHLFPMTHADIARAALIETLD